MSRAKAQEWLCSKLGIHFPYVSMGKVDSLDLFGGNELMIFAFYEHNKNRYKKVLDIGANLGLHSILMDKLGWNAMAFEPDPEIAEHLRKNLSANGIDFAKTRQAAVSDHDGSAQFIRVMNNLTGSCLVGSAKEPFGPLETITVRTIGCVELFDWADLAKIDVEGHESVLLQCVTAAHLEHLDLICELRGHKEAAVVLDHIDSIGGVIYTQKNDWKPVECLSDMPVRHQEGSIFISKRGGPWTTPL